MTDKERRKARFWARWQSRLITLGSIAAVCVLCVGATQEGGCEGSSNATKAEAAVVERQQAQYNASQPVPAFDWSLERDLLIQLYQIRNERVATHAVWRSDYGMVEGDCPAMGYGLPADTSLTNPLKVEWTINHGGVAVGQAEPNGTFQSQNTMATFVFCLGPGGAIEPVYVESKVTTYPYPVKVDYDKNRVQRAGQAAVTIKPPQ